MPISYGYDIVNGSRLHLNWAKRRNKIPYISSLDSYTTTLEKQYKKIQEKLQIYYNLQEFIEYVCPSQNSKTYYISIPGLDHSLQLEEKHNFQYIDNVVIRTQEDELSRFLRSYDFVIIGRLTIRQRKTEIEVKGMELISNPAIPGEQAIVCTCANALGLTKLRDGTEVPVYGLYDSYSTVLTSNFIYSIPYMIGKLPQLQLWHEYIDWRRYFVKKESEKAIEIYKQELRDSWIIPKDKIISKDKNSKSLEELLEELPLLDNIEKFGKGEQIILSEPREGAESFPLIRLDVRINRKELFQEFLPKNKKPKFETWLRRFTKDSVELVFSLRARETEYSLGERYLFFPNDIEPDCSELEQEYEKNCKKECDNIDQRYRQRITKETKEYMQPIKEEWNAKNDSFQNNLKQFEETQSQDRTILQQIDTKSEERNREITQKLSDMISNFEQKKEVEEELQKAQEEKDNLDSQIKSYQEKINKHDKERKNLNEEQKNIHNTIDILYKTQIQERQSKELEVIKQSKKEELNAQYKNDIIEKKDSIMKQQEQQHKDNDQEIQKIDEKFNKRIQQEVDKFIESQSQKQQENDEKKHSFLKSFLKDKKELEAIKQSKREELNAQYKDEIYKEKFEIIQKQEQQDKENAQKLLAIDTEVENRIQREIDILVKQKQRENDSNSKQFYKYLSQFENYDKTNLENIALTSEIKEQLDEMQKILNSKKKTNESQKQCESEQRKLQSQLKSEKENIDTISQKIRNLEDKQNKLHDRIVYLYTNQIEKYQSELEKEKRVDLENQYRDDIEEEKKEITNQLTKKFEHDKAEKIENETIRQYQIYFRPNNNNSEDSIDIVKLEEQLNAKLKYIMPLRNERTKNAKNTEEIEKPTIELKYDPVAERAKINRQSRALESLQKGYFRNPFLPLYLFSPESLKPEETIKEEIEWFLTNLNDSQQEAVIKALASANLFLLQGPPGTGKTQVITEITAQCVKQGLKVLISSETHKAIDNVFERLPKWPSIIPLRLIPSYSKKTTEYSPENLVDNLYLNIRHALEKKIERITKFEETKDNFQDMMSNLEYDYQKILELEESIKKEKRQIESLENKNREIEQDITKEQESLSNIQEQNDSYKQTLKKLDNFVFNDFGSATQAKLNNFIQTFSCLFELNIKDIPQVMKMNDETLKREMSIIFSNEDDANLEAQLSETKKQMLIYMDDNGDILYDHPEVKKLKKQLAELTNRKNQKKTNQNIADLEIIKLFPSILKNKEQFKSSLINEVHSFQIKIHDFQDRNKKLIQEQQRPWQEKEDEKKQSIENKNREKENNSIELERLRENPNIKEHKELKRSLITKITDFFEEFDINREYKHDSLTDAFKIMREEWEILEQQDSSSDKIKNNIALYKDIAEYLKKDDILEQDRKKYTRYIYDHANVFGITCTSRDNYTPDQLKELEDYGIKSVDLKEKNIDVVIIDEVSKSSFLDLLIPMLLGKKIILVGDHRQLPPMYDLRHMRDDDFEDLDENMITPEKNNEYTELYEECFFKTLYENIDPAFKVMLNKQYRCHSHIMEVFNHFYRGQGENAKGLTIGKAQQDNEKEHNITVKINGKTIISPEKHVYFINCQQHEARAYEGSTSFINDEEANVAITLVKEIGQCVEKEIKEKKLSEDNKPSIGIICTYGDQASLIKKKKHNKKFKGFSDKPEEKFIISTVDDFQGDERDIIIVSMVRNPERRASAEFIKQFERINVALSRARKLLIVIGNRNFLEKQTIDLPNLDGKRYLDQINFQVYKSIIDTISYRGRIIDASDIIPEKK